ILKANDAAVLGLAEKQGVKRLISLPVALVTIIFLAPNLVAIVRRQSLERRDRDEGNAIGVMQPQARLDDTLIAQADNQPRMRGRRQLGHLAEPLCAVAPTLEGEAIECD